jgi:VTC domain
MTPGAIPTVWPATEAGCPPNLHLTVMCPAAITPALSKRVEQKFFVAPQRETLALALLQRTCRPDPVHPHDQVNSLYFDTFDLDQHERSDSGDFAKDKVRIRWYGQEHDPHKTIVGAAFLSAAPSIGRADRAQSSTEANGEVTVWLELKSRRGFASTKQRLPLSVPPGALSFRALGKGILPPRVLRETVAGFGFFARGHLRPVVTISYWRYRFVEPRTGFRISIDSHIRSSMVMPGRGIGERGLELPGAVIEVKGPVFDMPVPLLQLAQIGASWTRYSKYSSSLDAHAATRGGVSRLWPSGMMEKEPGVLALVPGVLDSGESVQLPARALLVEDYETK